MMSIPAYTVSTPNQIRDYCPVQAMYMDDLGIRWEWESLQDETINIPAQAKMIPFYVAHVAWIHVIFRTIANCLGVRFVSYTRKVRGE